MIWYTFTYSQFFGERGVIACGAVALFVLTTFSSRGILIFRLSNFGVFYVLHVTYLLSKLAPSGVM